MNSQQTGYILMNFRRLIRNLLVFSVDSIDDLPVSGIEGETVTVRSFYPTKPKEPIDPPFREHGGGTFIWDATGGKEFHNGGTIIDPTHSSSAGSTGWWGANRPAINKSWGVWKRLYDGAVNVKWFGARGDGSNNDFYAIQACIELLRSRNNVGEYIDASVKNCHKAAIKDRLDKS